MKEERCRNSSEWISDLTSSGTLDLVFELFQSSFGERIDVLWIVFDRVRLSELDMVEGLSKMSKRAPEMSLTSMTRVDTDQISHLSVI